jgi:Holliday junction DNA helicase RuvB
MSAPLRDRFGVIHRLSFYEPKDLEEIIEKGAHKLKVPVDKQSVLEIAKRARGTPRIALKLLKRARDFVQVKAEGRLTHALTKDALDMLEVDSVGLDSSDIGYLRAIIEKHGGGPVGIETIASTISEDIGTVEEVIEPYLMQIGFLKKTTRGRVATPAAYQHLNIIIPKQSKQQKLLF